MQTADAADDEPNDQPPIFSSVSKYKGKESVQRTTKKTVKTVLLPERSYESSIAEDMLLKGDNTPRRVTSYCVADSFNLKLLEKNLRAEKAFRYFFRYDEVFYAAYTGEQNMSQLIEYNPTCILATGKRREEYEDSIYCGVCLPCSAASERAVGEVFFFEYGVVVLWGLEEEDEHRIIELTAACQNGGYEEDYYEIEDMMFSYNVHKQPCINSDLVVLHDGDKMVKTALTHAFAQSVRLEYFEELIVRKINETKDIPKKIARGEKIIKKNELMQTIGELFALRMNVNLISNVLDTPELVWAESQIEPLYQTARRYMEINRRVDIINQRCDVIADLLDFLKGSIDRKHDTKLEMIVIILIVIEVILGLVEIFISLKFH
eukprot:GHVN01027441.1.p1 GENE.GHVN01027441.1~~GHVN01027441.1.p1  ORF type:complete len:377 (+),score=49.82 GHVN01027441.1:186-1316(+)